MSVEDRFNAAVNVIRGLPKNGPYQPSNDMLLTFYSLFKQATKGKCTERQPAFWNVVSKAKWDAWNRLGDMPKEVAMQKYVDELKKIVETMSYTDTVANFLEYGSGDADNVSINDLELVAPEVIQQARSRPNSPLASRDTSPVRASPVTPPPTITVPPTVANGATPLLVNGHHQNGLTIAAKQQLTNGYRHHAYQNGNVQSDLSDDEYIDTVDDSETESTFRPIEAVHIARGGVTSAGRISQTSFGVNDQFYSIPSSASMILGGGSPEVMSQLTRAIERLNASVQQVNNRINVVEQSVSSLRSTIQQGGRAVVGRSKKLPPWWPLDEISPRMLAFIILWPLVINRMMVWLQRRK
ncbi:acyl-CoA-binding domain-containing protein 5 [Uranotaenia lowii]|uniref:acyl-CoA-binding domain-containing protein 5 n=1 Tax=Uranotaenia lowii TaxID=190385 RepID=UPI0024787C2A|nr:acyl-CoA-binding domain-containing protein 5 [Uranotaenia lowii]XP_055607843.1 acyl-CoA-binding domain-containing protein 5 [Uranotaenia lowii]XP_055607928.1 acyl-CoA-binding domain-containing protein 5 [Uranotaenia lowii]XP_055608007.1 acyl-CoA-binding domain-containing protein 5 [Uranotaenia lowii]XP_055608086.1 acyl-CoA-binding domain-containing protein 5 [Uranotaenia lowii]XP_055608166.1 acyl-CoA-binding domain-containing protein 5 [Uranotaenia lowii]XP_055608248.1 acyl-CoA-binding dom